MRTPRRVGVLAAVAASAAFTVGGAGAALAAPAAPAAPANFCPSPKATVPGYNTPPNCRVTITVTVVIDGQSFSFTASYFLPFESGKIFLHSTPVQVGTFTANSAGVATGTVTVPAGLAPGVHTLELRGNDGTDLTTNFTVVAPSSTTTGSGSTLPFTGADVAGLAGGGLGLIVGGGLLTVVFRRRRSTPAA